MMQRPSWSYEIRRWPASGALTLAGLVLVIAATATPTHAQVYRYTALHRFTGADGAFPMGAVTRDSAGNLYGTTAGGGVTTGTCGVYGCGVVFKLDATGEETVLYKYTGGADGAFPYAGVIRDSAGHLYGTTSLDGVSNSNCPSGCGAVFKLEAAGKQTVLYNFTGYPDGAVPYGGVIRDATGNFYGTTSSGGAWFQGTVFELDATGKEAVLYNFGGGSDGGQPRAGVIRDSSGNLYGTTFSAGLFSVACQFGCGVVFKLDTTGHETVLHTFTAGTDGANPLAGVIRDATGNLYGTTAGGGASNSGVVFKLDTAGNETVLYTFTGGADGAYPHGGVIRDSAGNLYGTTTDGGIITGSCAPMGCGVVFKLDSAGKQTVLHSFTGTDGGYPNAGLVRDSAGNLYGTALQGGVTTGRCAPGGCGVAFQLSPQ